MCGQSGEGRPHSVGSHVRYTPPDAASTVICLRQCRFKGLPAYILTRLQNIFSFIFSAQYESGSFLHQFNSDLFKIYNIKSRNNHVWDQELNLLANTGLLNWLNKYYKCHSLTIHLKIVQLPCILHLDTDCGLWNAFSGRYN